MLARVSSNGETISVFSALDLAARAARRDILLMMIKSRPMI